MSEQAKKVLLTLASVFGGLIVLWLLAILFFRSSVPAGHVGILVNLYGSEKGVQSEEKGVGRYYLTWNEEIYLFPTYKQIHNYEQPFSFQTSDSMSITALVGVEYSVDPSMVSKVFQTYRKGVQEITEINIRQNISDALINHSGEMDINELPAGGKTKLLSQVTSDLQAQYKPVGIQIHKLFWLSDLNYPEKIQQSINDKIEATQKALTRDNEIAGSIAEAKAKIEKAKGDAESIKLVSTAEAEAISRRAEAIRNNPEVLQLEAINKWNGVLPQYMTDGSTTPFVEVKTK